MPTQAYERGFLRNETAPNMLIKDIKLGSYGFVLPSSWGEMIILNVDIKQIIKSKHFKFKQLLVSLIKKVVHNFGNNLKKYLCQRFDRVGQK